jgi:ElaB/YqjD/DUF883 family membrane-anchored ribosome-binding protein
MSEYDSIDHLKKKVVEFKDIHGSMAKDMANDMELRLAELKMRTEEFVKKNPLTSLAIAFGIGFLIAKIIRRK